MHMHWSEWLAERVIEEKKEPYVITAGITTSGPAHLGTLCEFLFPSAIQKALKKRKKKCDFYFIADIFDAFDSVPLAMEKYRKELEPHLGEPLCDVPDPTGKSKSFGDHFLDEVRLLMKKFGVDAKIVRANEYYKAGKFDKYARFFLKHEKEARKIVEETSGKQEKKDWSPIMPVCEKCGRIATTRVVSHDGENYEYVCDKDVGYTRGCGFKGKSSISEHRYKLVWRLHWPSWKQVFKSSIEGAGIDHHTKGGSEDTCRAITLNLLKADYHIPYRYGFVLLKGKKYSKSKGIGMGVTDLIKLVPPEVIKYMLFRPDLEENIDVNPTSQSLLRTLEEFQQAAELAKKKIDELNRSERKRAIAFSLSTDKTRWKVPFLDMLLYYQIYGDWKKVGKLSEDPKGADYLKDYIEEWLSRKFVPDEYYFRYSPDPEKAAENAKGFIASLDESMDALAVHNAVFDFAKKRGVEPRVLFRELYNALIGKDRGPRMGKLVVALGIKQIKKDFGA